MNGADIAIINSYIQLSNHFAKSYDDKCEAIASLADLWEKHGPMMAKMIGCDRHTFQSSGIFYEVLFRKIKLVNAEMAAALDPKTAEEGDCFEICKFYTLFLEHLRKDHSEMLTLVLEHLATQTGFNSSIVLDIFSFFDNLYAEDSAENWWSCLRSDDTIVLEGLSTPKRGFNTSTFATPTATARRLRTAASSARRSPIAEAVDSPTMKFLRSERELKQLKTKISGLEQNIEDFEADNSVLTKTNRELKLQIDELKGNAAGNRDTAQNAEKHALELSSALEARQNEVTSLTHQLEECRTLIRSEHRHLEELEAERDSLAAKLETVTHDRDVCIKQMRELRNSNEQEFSNWRQKEQSFIEQLRVTAIEKADVVEQLVAIEDLKLGLDTENKRLARAFDELSIVSSLNKQEADNALTKLKEAREQHLETIEKMQQESAERLKMADDKVERLQKELDDERSDKKSLQNLLNDLNEKALSNDKESHEKSEGYLSVRSCLEATKQRMELLQIEIDSKEANYKIQSQQLVRLKESFEYETSIRTQLSNQMKDKEAAFKAEIAKKSEAVTELEEKLKETTEMFQKATEEKKAEIEKKDEIIKDIKKDNEELRAKVESCEHQEVYFVERTKFKATGKLAESRSYSSTDSLGDVLDKENEDETEEEIMQVVSATPRKSIAFSVDLNGESTMKGNPLGFRTDMNNPRQSICSINEDTFDRASMTRTSIRSDTLTLGSVHSASGFKTPFTPSGTSKDRVNVLTARNEKVKPHLKCSYTSEMGLVSSPSADEENVKKGATIKARKSRRDSIASVFSFKKN